MKRIIGKINPKDRHVTIWGAGVSGLLIGYYLKETGYRITIYEKSNKIGGKINTKKTPFGPAETGANAIFVNADCMDLINELKLEPIPATKKLRRLLLLNGKPKRPFQFSLLSKIALNSHVKPPLITDGLTVSEFFKPLLGPEIVKNYLSPALGGIYAVEASHLHFKSVFPEVSDKAQFESYWEFLLTLRKNKKNQPKLDLMGSVSFEGGMQTFVNRLAEILKPDIKLNYKESFRVKGNTIVCTDAVSAAELVAEVKPEVANELKRIRYQELSTVTVFLKREIKSLQKSFGVLIPLDANYHASGVLNNKAIFPSNNPNVFSYTLICRKKVTEEEVHQDLKYLYPEFVPEDIEHLEHTYWDRAIPIYDLQRYLSVKKLHQIMKDETNFAIFGNYVAGISLREMISAARKFANNPTEQIEIR